MSEDCRCANSYYSNRPQLKLESTTTNQLNYQPYTIPPRQQQPTITITQKRYDPDVLKSNYNSTFTKPTPVKDTNIDQGDSLSRHLYNKPKHLPFQSDTSYKQSYPKHQIKVDKSPAYEYKPNPNKFEGESSYKSTFVPKNNPTVHSQDLATLKDYMSKKVKVPFEGRTSYSDTFQNPGVKYEKQPEYKYQPKQTKFQGQSSYKSTFRQLPKEAYGNGAEYCPVHPGKVAIK